MMANDLNDRQVDGTFNRNNHKWIMSALTFLEDDTAVWATPYLESLSTGTMPFNTWDEFKNVFKVRFETVDEKADTKEALQKLWQGKLTAGEYMARFKELMSCTDYSSANLRDCYYKHLSTEVKDDLVHTERKTMTLKELITVVIDIDTHIHT